MAYRESWRDQGACQALEVTDPPLWAAFYAPTTATRAPAKALCESCPVRKQCLRDALARGEVWGVWGGCDEVDLRRTLGIDTNGVERDRHKKPRCPLCRAETDRLRLPAPAPGRPENLVQCADCGFWWTAATSVAAVRRFAGKPAQAVAAVPRPKTNKSPVRVTVPRRRIPTTTASRNRRPVQLPLPSAAPQEILESLAASSGPPA